MIKSALAMMIASATSSRNWLCSGRVMNGLISRRLQRVAESEQHRRDRHQHDQRVEMEPGEQHHGDEHATVIISPWAKLTTRTTPKMTESPSAIRP